MDRAGRFSGDCGGSGGDSGEITLSSDVASPEPLYYAVTRDGRALVWAGDVAAVAADPAVDRRLDAAALVEECVLRFPTGDRTAFAAVRRVPSGGAVRALAGRDGRLRVTVASRDPAPAAAAATAVKAAAATTSPAPTADDRGLDARGLRERLLDAVSSALRGGGAVLLSGGVDSSVLAALAAQAAPACAGPVFAVTAAGDDGGAAADRDAARRVCAAVGLRGVEAAAGGGASPLDLWAEVVRRTASPQPPGAAIFLAAEAIRASARAAAREPGGDGRAAPVLLCGEGADELFAGYFFIYPHPRLYVDGLKRRLDGLSRSCARAGGDLRRRLAAWDELSSDALFSALYWMNISERLPSLHLHQARAEAAPTPVAFPYLDRGVAGFALAQPPRALVSGGVTKRPLRALVATLLPGGLGEAIAARPKVGLPEATAGLRAAVTAALDGVEGAAWDAHPLRWLYADRLAMFTADLFLFTFCVAGGRPPDGFDPRRLYRLFDRDRAWREAAPDFFSAETG